MKFLVLALDFDGTIAQNDTLDPEVRKAIADLHAQGIVVLLVTGRILSDLSRVAGAYTLSMQSAPKLPLANWLRTCIRSW